MFTKTSSRPCDESLRLSVCFGTLVCTVGGVTTPEIAVRDGYALSQCRCRDKFMLSILREWGVIVGTPRVLSAKAVSSTPGLQDFP